MNAILQFEVRKRHNPEDSSCRYEVIQTTFDFAVEAKITSNTTVNSKYILGL